MIMQDKLEKERNDAKNAVEEYVYEFRDKLCGPYEKFINEQVCVELCFYSNNLIKCFISNLTFKSPRLCNELFENRKLEIEIEQSPGEKLISNVPFYSNLS